MIAQPKQQQAVPFSEFGKAIRDNFAAMSEHELYTVDAAGDAVWDVYMDVFPPGTNEVFRERREHDCSCCKQFVRNVGNVVAIINGTMRSVWNLEQPVGYPYDDVAAALNSLVCNLDITGIYRTSESAFGAQTTHELRDGKAHVWHHFSCAVPKSKRLRPAWLGPFRSHTESSAQLLNRAIEVITPESCSTVLDLIADGSLYRGAEFKSAVEWVQRVVTSHADSAWTDIDLWPHVSHKYARTINVAIGTLLVDLSDGFDLERAVASYEEKVAPQNYRRPTALVTPAMVERALATVDELGLRDSLERRHARIDDVSVRDVLFVDNEARTTMRDPLAETLLSGSKRRPRKAQSAGAQDITVTDFLRDVLPSAKTLHVVPEREHMSNLMSVTAPMHAAAPPLFNWGNGFAWSYAGDVTDSIKERVKRAGGNVDAALRVSLSWFNYDDLDLHCKLPPRRGGLIGDHIFFGNKQGILDVDMNAGSRSSREPVENMQWRTMPRDGVYRFEVHQFYKRESVDVGFEIEIEHGGGVLNATYDKVVASNQTVSFSIEILNGEVTDISFGDAFTLGSSQTERWGIQTGERVPVETIITSPNHWGGEHGNLHWFFLLRGCKNPDPVRGLYNEFLRSDLQEHRKVFELLGDRTKAPYSYDQLSGLGFSSTKRATLPVVVDGGRVYNVRF